MTEEEITALRQTLDYLRLEEGNSHKGYFYSGWAGERLKQLLTRWQAATADHSPASTDD